ncbi:MAG: hypothetical protein LLG37_09325 [Spirochaetia bacterium]|nr:hypothetical protein [Spirochaetia bacterium]
MTDKTQAVLYLLVFALVSCAVFMVIPHSTAAVFMAVSFVVNILLFRTLYGKGKK